MDDSERANWFDTEGNLYVSPANKSLKQSVTFICISQFERTPLEDFQEGAASDGIECRIITRRRGNTEEHMLLIVELESIARELIMEAPFIRTTRKLAQLQNFREFVLRERSQTRQSLRRARELLSSLESPLVASRKAMDVKERANWTDTEGCLYVTDPGSNSNAGEASMFVSQSQRDPLDDFASGALRDGVLSTVYHRLRTTDEYTVRIRRLDAIAREISLELPYLRTKKRREQARRFKEYLFKPRVRVGKSLRAAREILSNGPVV